MTFTHVNTNKYRTPVQIHWIFIIITIALMAQRNNPSIFSCIWLTLSPNMCPNYFRILFLIFATRI